MNFSEYGSDSDSSPDDSSVVESTVAPEATNNVIATPSTEVLDQKRTGTDGQDKPEEAAAGSDADAELQRKISAFAEKMEQTGASFTDNLKQTKEFRNPYFIFKLIDHMQINQVGSNYPRDKFDPAQYPKKYFKENLPFARAEGKPQTSRPVTAGTAQNSIGDETNVDKKPRLESTH